MKTDNEIWKEIKGFEGMYKVSNLGNVKSVIFPKHKILKPFQNRSGLQVGLHADSITTKYYIHILVYNAFKRYKKSADKHFIKHINGIRTDNRIDNLKAVKTRGLNKHELKEQRDELLKRLQSLVLSMSGHPDCTKGSEFDDLSSLAQELINKIKDNEKSS